MQTVDLDKLSPEQLAELEKKVAEKKKAEKEKRHQDRQAYGDIVDETVRRLVKDLKEVSRMLIEKKQEVFKSFETILIMKQELYGIKADQQSHTFTSADSMMSVKIGHRTIDSYDDTVNEGIAIVKKYLKSLAVDENTGNLIDTIMELLKKDAKGNLKPGATLELEKLAEKIGNESFLDGLSIIKNSYRQARTCQFVEVRYKDEKGTERSLPLSMSAAE
jgi:hypothetical protein